jgi:hypothetical protein
MIVGKHYQILGTSPFSASVLRRIAFIMFAQQIGLTLKRSAQSSPSYQPIGS